MVHVVPCFGLKSLQELPNGLLCFTVLSNSDVQHLSSLCCLPLFYIKAWELQDLNLSIYEAATMHAELFLMFTYYLRSHRHHFENNGTKIFLVSMVFSPRALRGGTG